MNSSCQPGLTPKQWRFEYLLVGPKTTRMWRIFLSEVTEAREVFTTNEVRELLGDDHPALKEILSLFSQTHERIIIRPYKAFEPLPDLLKILGEGFVGRVLRSSVPKKIWTSKDGWTWLHFPGDSAE